MEKRLDRMYMTNIWNAPARGNLSNHHQIKCNCSIHPPSNQIIPPFTILSYKTSLLSNIPICHPIIYISICHLIKCNLSQPVYQMRSLSLHHLSRCPLCIHHPIRCHPSIYHPIRCQLSLHNPTRCHLPIRCHLSTIQSDAISSSSNQMPPLSPPSNQMPSLSPPSNQLLGRMGQEGGTLQMTDFMCSRIRMKWRLNSRPSPCKHI